MLKNVKKGVAQQPFNGALQRNSGFRIAALSSVRDAGLRLIVQEGPATAVDGRGHCVKGNAHLRTGAPLPRHAALAGWNLWQGAGPAGTRRPFLRARNFGTGSAPNVRRPAHAATEADGLPL